MLTDAQTVGSADWYLLRLGAGLTSDLSDLQSLERYDTGDHPLPIGNQNLRETYRKYQKMSRSNYCGLITSTVCERLLVTGFFAGSGASRATDTRAWQIWQANSLDAESGVLHRRAVALRRGYVIVGPPDPNDPETPDVPIITVESPFQVYHEPDPVRPRRVAAAIKTYFDAIRNRQVALVYLPKMTVYYRAVKGGDEATVWRPEAWELDVTEATPTATVPNTIGIVPVVPFINRRDVSPMGFGEFEDVVDVQDRINTTVLDRLVIQAMQAFRQRYAIGLDLVDQNGNPTKAFNPGADLIWSIPNDGDGNQGVKFGDFEQSDLDPIIKATESDVAVMGNLSRTPPHYLTGQLVNVSGDALTVAESGLVSKIRATQTEFGEGWERVQFIASKYDGRDEVGQDSAISWIDPERRSLASLADAAVKYQNAGVPFRERMALLGFTPSEIDRMEQERVKDSLLASLNSPLSVDPGASAATVNVAQTAPGGPVPAGPPQPAAPASA